MVPATATSTSPCGDDNALRPLVSRFGFSCRRSSRVKAKRHGGDGEQPLGRVTLYSIQGCPHCVQAKATLGRLGVPVCDVDLGKHPGLRARVKELTGRTTVPQIFFNSVHIGGNDELQKMNPTELERLVNLVTNEPISIDGPPLPMDDPSEETVNESDGAAELSLILRDLILKLFTQHLSSDGKFVDYKGMSANPAFDRYCDLAIQLQRVELLSLSREEKLAFFITSTMHWLFMGFCVLELPPTCGKGTSSSTM
ncbi:hypothetical protein WMY93_002929 [Mugilogobius chulae]|uniref:Glutaredoxin domain-containing protein n=1 Tax=Mugilogobius chulae TaxID=88201 RepID=A0AAW0PUW2_9GOBI